MKPTKLESMIKKATSPDYGDKQDAAEMHKELTETLEELMRLAYVAGESEFAAKVYYDIKDWIK